MRSPTYRSIGPRAPTVSRTPTSVETIERTGLVTSPTLSPSAVSLRVPTLDSPVRSVDFFDPPEEAPDPIDVVRERDQRDTVEPSPEAGRDPSPHHHYDPWYAGWYVHPYYRNQHITSAVWYPGLGYTDPWGPQWTPVGRRGWVWVPGYWANGFWHPGSWVPARHLAPRTGFVWTTGFWQTNNVYVDGYWRPEEREDGEWQWVEGYYLEDGSYVPGHWRPTADGPEGYLWEPGFWKGDGYVDGFWRPEYRRGYQWQSAYYDVDGLFHAGYWLPMVDQDGFIWVPGWFDGNAWVEGYWVSDDEFDKELVSIDIGEGIGDGEVIDNQSPTEDEFDKVDSLGLPVSFE